MFGCGVLLQGPPRTRYWAWSACTRHLALPVRRLILCSLALLASSPVVAQRWEVGAGASSLLLTDGDVTASAPELYARYHTTSRLAYSVAVNTLATRETDREMLIYAGRWYDRTRVHGEAGVRYAFLTDKRQDLGAAAGLSVGYRDEITYVEAYYPAFFEGRPGVLDDLLRECEALPDCVSRRYEIRADQGVGTGPFVGFARHRKGLAGGAYAELEYGIRVGPVRAALHGGLRYYRIGPPQHDMSWQGGVRVGARF